MTFLNRLLNDEPTVNLRLTRASLVGIGIAVALGTVLGKLLWFYMLDFLLRGL